MKPRFEDPEVADVFARYPGDVRDSLLELRALILTTAAETAGVGQLNETLRWGQPSYITSKPKSGTTIRIGPFGERSFALFVHCQTTLVAQFRETYGAKLRFDGVRALVWDVGDPLPTKIVKRCIEAALLYHTRKRSRVAQRVG